MDSKQIELYLEACKCLRAHFDGSYPDLNGNFSDELGICYNIYAYFESIGIYEESESIVQDLAKGWEHHSGVWVFPVGGGLEYHREGSLWGEDHYGKRRKELLTFIIDKLEKMYCEDMRND